MDKREEGLKELRRILSNLWQQETHWEEALEEIRKFGVPRDYNFYIQTLLDGISRGLLTADDVEKEIAEIIEWEVERKTKRGKRKTALVA